jgi:hypothetical protein
MTLAPEGNPKGIALAVRESRTIVGADCVFTSAEGMDEIGLQRKYPGSNSITQIRKGEIFDAHLDAVARYFTKR